MLPLYPISIDPKHPAMQESNADAQYIREFAVHYGDKASQEPANAVKELTGQSNDVNDGHGGKYVWIVPTYTTDAQAAATAFELLLTDDRVPGLDDLALGAGGKFRYLVPKADPNVSKKITEAILFRSAGSVPHPPQTWDVLGPDLDKGRGKPWLYVVFRTVSA